MDVAGVCGSCFTAGFIVDKVSLFPFVAGIVLAVFAMTGAPEALEKARNCVRGDKTEKTD